MRRPAALAWFTAGVLALAACGSSTPDEPAAEVGRTEPATTEPATTEPGTESPVAPTSEPEPDAAPDQAATTTAPTIAGEPPATTLPEPEAPSMVWPDDGCSADNSPTAAMAAAGPSPELELRAESASAEGPLPDLAVRRVNCAGGWVNLRNELPADRPLLVWFWAPH